MRAAWLLVPLLGLLELAGLEWTSHRAPRFDDYAQLVAPMRELARPDDAVLVAPPWIDAPVRRALGDGHVGREITGRAIEISILGARADDARGLDEVGRREVGPFTLRVLEDRHARAPRYDFVEHLLDASIDGCAPSRDAKGVSSPTFLGPPTLGRERFVCGGATARDVGVTTIDDERERPRRCVWAVAPRTLRYEGVALGDVLEGHTALPWLLERDGHGAPIELEVWIDGDRLGSVTHRAGEGWSAFSIPLGVHARATAATVELRAIATEQRPFCFEAHTR